MMCAEPVRWARLMDTIAEVLARYLRAQVVAGADVVQLFDSWAGALAPEDYERSVLPYTRRVLANVSRVVPRIHFATGNPARVGRRAAADAEAVSADWRLPLDEAWGRIGHERAIQGNLDPAVCRAPWRVVEERAEDVLRRAAGRPGHVFNLGHGVLPDTDADTLARLSLLVKERTSAVAA